MNRYIISVLKDGEFYDAYILADDERDEETFRKHLDLAYPKKLGYQPVFSNRPHLETNPITGELIED